LYLENNRVKQYPIKAVLSWSSVVIWMAVIFAFSHQSATQSGQLSLSIADTIVRLIYKQADQTFILWVNQLLRNFAHGFIYFILGLMTSWAFSETGIHDARNALFSFVICALYAASDELHQAFVPGRAAQLSDYFIDLTGIVLALILYQIQAALRFLHQDLVVRRKESPRRS